MDNSDTSQQAYWAHVQRAAETVAERVEAGEDANDVIHQEADGSFWVIYYHAAHACLLHSDNESALFEAGDLSDAQSWEEATTRMAFYAHEVDIAQQYARLLEEQDV